MSWMKKLSIGLAVLGLAAFAGCGGGGGKDGAKDAAKDGKKDGGTAKDGKTEPAKPSRTFEKRDAKTPDGVMITEVKMPKSAWDMMSDAKAGDYAEYEMAGGTSMKMEIFDIVEGAIVQINHIKGTGFENKSGTKMLFTEADGGAKDKAPDVKKGNEKIKVGDKELDCEWTEAGGAKTWRSKDVPCGGTVKSEAGGMTTMMLKSFKRG
jgi:hypothetical protein